jgi:hypothetical protein
MTNALDNLQIVFDRTDWKLLAKQRRSLIYLSGSDEYLASLLNWLTAVQDAAQMDGYRVQPLAEDEEATQ